MLEEINYFHKQNQMFEFWHTNVLFFLLIKDFFTKKMHDLQEVTVLIRVIE